MLSVSIEFYFFMTDDVRDVRQTILTLKLIVIARLNSPYSQLLMIKPGYLKVS